MSWKKTAFTKDGSNDEISIKVQRYGCIREYIGMIWHPETGNGRMQLNLWSTKDKRHENQHRILMWVLREGLHQQNCSPEDVQVLTERWCQSPCLHADAIDLLNWKPTNKWVWRRYCPRISLLRHVSRMGAGKCRITSTAHKQHIDCSSVPKASHFLKHIWLIIPK